MTNASGDDAAGGAKRKLVGFDHFMKNRTNPKTDKFGILRFHHLEFWCSDATQASHRFTWGLGMPEVARSDLASGNQTYASHVLQSGETVFAFTAPYFNEPSVRGDQSNIPFPAFDQKNAHEFVAKHGLAVRALGIRVENATEAYNISTANGARGVTPPSVHTDKVTGKSMTVSEIAYFGDTVLRWVSGDFDGPMLPNYVVSPRAGMKDGILSYGINRIDHTVSNVPNLFEAVDYAMKATGMHEFSEFTAEDVGTVDSGLNSMVLASNNEFVLLPINEPTFGTRRKSQIQTYLEHNNGAGLQHIALLTDDIFSTMREMRKRSHIGGFEFMPKPSDSYYAKAPKRIGEDSLTKEQYAELEELGLLVDRDDQGVLLQVFTKPLGDRPTVFIEIIQRIGCDKDEHGQKKVQGAGCGGFGKGNFSELFKSIEEFEKTLEAKGPMYG
jgi:4-hydroxyphenylpyruvate dioxygenase